MKKTQIKTVSASVEIANAFIESIENNCVDLTANKEFKTRLDALRKCVDDMYAVGNGNEVSDMYLTLEYRPIPHTATDISSANKKIL